MTTSRIVLAILTLAMSTQVGCHALVGVRYHEGADCTSCDFVQNGVEDTIVQAASDETNGSNEMIPPHSRFHPVPTRPVFEPVVAEPFVHRPNLPVSVASTQSVSPWSDVAEAVSQVNRIASDGKNDDPAPKLRLLETFTASALPTPVTASETASISAPPIATASATPTAHISATASTSTTSPQLTSRRRNVAVQASAMQNLASTKASEPATPEVAPSQAKASNAEAPVAKTANLWRPRVAR